MKEHIKETIDNSKKLKGNQEGFLITIKNLDTGEVLLSERTKSIIGAFNTSTHENRGLVLSACPTTTLIEVIEAVEESVREVKKKVVNEFEKLCAKKFLNETLGGCDE